jgi:hypothetical protein
MMSMNREQAFVDLPTGSRRYGRLAACGTTRRFMGSPRGFSAVHNAPEPCGLALDHAHALALPFGIKSKSKSKSKSRDRLMGSVHGLSAVHSALEPAGTFNVQRSTSNRKPSTINLPTINRYMGSASCGRRWSGGRAGVCFTVRGLASLDVNEEIIYANHM